MWKKISYSGLYQRIRFPKHYKDVKEEFHFYQDTIGKKNKIIFDVGANTGEKASIFKRLAKQVICFEPSPNAAKTLRSRFAFSNVTIVPVAISNSVSLSELYVVDGIETLNSINRKQLKTVIQPVAKGRKVNTIEVPTETLDMAIQKFGLPEYIKIDVEGNEREVIMGLSIPVKYLSFENCTTLFLKEGIESIDHLIHISNGEALFNIYVEGSFFFPAFSDGELIKEHLRNNNYGAAEIFCQSL